MDMTGDKKTTMSADWIETYQILFQNVFMHK